MEAGGKPQDKDCQTNFFVRPGETKKKGGSSLPLETNKKKVFVPKVMARGWGTDYLRGPRAQLDWGGAVSLAGQLAFLAAVPVNTGGQEG